MVLATEQKNMVMANGKKFSTGNHPVETLVPMLHLRNAGFEFEIVTPTGAPVVLEMWAFPSEDTKVKGLYDELSDSFASPRSLADFVATSLDNAERYAALAAGQRVLIHAGSGGVGSLAIQFAKHAGAWVATTASPRSKDLVLGLGADQFVDYTSERFEDAVEPCDLVFDMLGGETLARSFDVVKQRGTIVSIKGDAPEGLPTERNVAFHSYFMQPNGAQLTEIATLIQNGTVRPLLDSTFPLDDVAAAYEYAQSGRATGKVAITITNHGA